MIHLAHILFEPVLLRQNLLSRLDVRIKIICCLLVLIINLIMPGNIFQIFFLIFYILVALSWKVRLRYIFGRLFIPLLIVIFLKSTRLADFHLALVILAGVSCVSLLSFSTPIDKILAALRKLGCPLILAEIAFMMYKYIFIFFEEVDSIYHAQVVRLGYINFKNSLASLSVLVGMLIMRSFQRATACYEAMLARGYKDKLFY